MKPRIVNNSIAETLRFPSASLFGTGAQVLTTENNGLNGILETQTGSAGRAWNSVNLTLVAGQWYCISFEVIAFSGFSGATSSNNGFKFTAAPSLGDHTIDGADILAGGVGRYACIFADAIGGSFTYRLGVGLDSNLAFHNLTFKNIMLETIDVNAGGFPSEYIYPQFKSAVNRTNYTAMNTNKRVTESLGPSFPFEKGHVILAFGDSRNDEVIDFGNALSNSLGSKGVCYAHADGGWTTASVLGPTAKKGFTLTSQKAFDGELLTRTFSTDGTEEIYDIFDYQVTPDIFMIANLGVNNIAAGNAGNLTIDTAMEEIRMICDEGILKGMKPCITEITPWNAAAAFSETNGDLIQTWALNRRLREYAESIDAIFVPLYKALADSTDPDKLSDGVGSTPDYSADGLHLNEEGSRLCAGLARSEINLWQQSLIRGDDNGRN